jgi:hypothetical protein
MIVVDDENGLGILHGADLFLEITRAADFNSHALSAEQALQRPLGKPC